MRLSFRAKDVEFVCNIFIFGVVLGFCCYCAVQIHRRFYRSDQIGTAKGSGYPQNSGSALMWWVVVSTLYSVVDNKKYNKLCGEIYDFKKRSRWLQSNVDS